MSKSYSGLIDMQYLPRVCCLLLSVCCLLLSVCCLLLLLLVSSIGYYNRYAAGDVVIRDCILGSTGKGFLHT